MMSLSKQQKIEDSSDMITNAQDCGELYPKCIVVDNNLEKESSVKVLPLTNTNAVSQAFYNPFLTPPKEEVNVARRGASPLSGPHKMANQYLFSSEKENSREVKLDHKNNQHWPEDIRKHNSELNTTSIGLPAQEKDHDDSSTESLHTNSFSPYIPDPPIDHVGCIAFKEMIKDEKDRHRSNMIPLMKQNSNQLVIARQETPKLR